MSWSEHSTENDINPFASRQAANPLLGTHTRLPTSDTNAASWLEEKSEEQQQPVPLDPEIPKLIFYTRMINLILSVLMVLSSLLSLVTTDSITTGVLACYVIVLSCLLCCYETHLKQISKVIALNFGFLFSAKSRAIFMIFIGSLLFSFSLFGKLVGCAMVANAFLNIFVLLKYPAFEDAQREDAQNEISQFLQSNPALTKQAMSYTMQAGSNFARENPEAAGALLRESIKSPTFASV